MTVCGNQMAMWSRKSLPSLGLCLALALTWMTGCAPRLAPVVPAGVVLAPGRYLTAVYRDPAFQPDRFSYTIQTFPVEQAQGITPPTFQSIFQDELTRAWQANGLKIAPQGEVVLAGTVQYVDLCGVSFKWLTGQISANLVVSGAITRGGATEFAFQDRLNLTSPVNPGPPAPKEGDLLLRAAARTFATHLLNELLLYGRPAEGK
jgi:hypothetical protein